MTDEDKQKQREEHERWDREARDALAPSATFKKGSEHYPSPSGPSSRYNTAPPLGNKPTYRKPRE
jgi:hypothetical protein